MIPKFLSNDIKINFSKSDITDIKITLLKNISKELNNIKPYIDQIAQKSPDMEETIDNFINLKATFKDLPKLEDILENFRQNTQNKPIKEYIKNLQKLIKRSILFLQKKESIKNGISQDIQKFIKDLNELQKEIENGDKIVEKKLSLLKSKFNILKSSLDKNEAFYLQKSFDNIVQKVKNKPIFKLTSIDKKEILNHLKNIIDSLTTIEKDNITLQKKIKNLLSNLSKVDKCVKEDVDSKILQDNLKNLQKSFKEIKTKLPKNISQHIEKELFAIKEILTQTKEPNKIKSFEIYIKNSIKNLKTTQTKIINQEKIIKNIGNISKNIKEIIALLPKSKEYIQIKKSLNHFTKDINSINLKENIKNSGIFYESKISEAIKNDILSKEAVKDDVKSILLQLKNNKTITKNHPHIIQNIDKTITQINAFSLNSLNLHTNSTYIPFSWDSLKDGSLSIAKLKKEDNFSCKIELDLENYGKIDVIMLFNKEFLSLKMDIKDENLKNRLKIDTPLLKLALSKIGFEPSIFFQNQKSQLQVYDDTIQSNLGVDIST